MQRQNRGGALGDVVRQRRDAGAKLAFDRQRQGELDDAAVLTAQCGIDGGKDERVAQRRGEVMLEKLAAEHLLGGGIGVDNPAARIEQDQRIGQRAEHRLCGRKLGVALGQLLPPHTDEPHDRQPQLAHHRIDAAHEGRRVLVACHEVDRREERHQPLQEQPHHDRHGDHDGS